MKNKFIKMQSKIYTADSPTFFRYVNERVGNDLNILEFGYEDFSKSSQILTPIVANSYIIHYILDGEGTVNYGANKYHLAKGDIFFLEPSDTKNYYPNKTNPWKYVWISFLGVKAKHLAYRAMLTASNPVYHVINQDEITDTFFRLLNHSSNKSTQDIRPIATLYDVISILIDERSSDDSEFNIGKMTYIDHAISHVSDNYADPTLTLQNVCASLHISYSYLSKIFHDLMGLTFNRFLNDFRIQRACDLLETTNLSLKEISEQVGYSDQFYFSKQFRRKLNMTPTNYRNI